MTASVADIEGAVARLRWFLLHGAVQRRVSPETGAVVGSVGQNGSQLYVYGEITGYYLHWLASLETTDEQVHAKAASALQWLSGYLQRNPPLTRIYFNAAQEDWRNQAVFAFDFAMIAAGSSRAAQRLGLVLPDALVAELQQQLQRFVAKDGTLLACLSTNAGAVLPLRWSTLGGSFTAKTASRILLCVEQIPLQPALLAACRQTLASIAQTAELNGLDMLHPTLYALEGCLLHPHVDLERLALWFDQIALLRAADGSLPESLQTLEVRRSDIIAQALRLAVMLEYGLGQHDRYVEARAAFTSALLERISIAGQISFQPGQTEANTWCAMFAEQALRLQLAAVQNLALPFAVEDLV